MGIETLLFVFLFIIVMAVAVGVVRMRRRFANRVKPPTENSSAKQP